MLTQSFTEDILVVAHSASWFVISNVPHLLRRLLSIVLGVISVYFIFNGKASMPVYCRVRDFFEVREDISTNMQGEINPSGCGKSTLCDMTTHIGYVVQMREQ